MARQPAPIYQIKVTLNRSSPPIWRRILVPANVTLLKLHDIVQIVMGWEDSHLHEFTRGGVTYGVPDYDAFNDFEIKDSARVKLSQVLRAEGERLGYEYDFGDSWQHTLLLEKILPRQKGATYPICVKGRRACPPEDVGGMWGYENFLDAIRNPDHEEHELYTTWIGGAFDPDFFDLEAVNGELQAMGRGRSTEAANPWAAVEEDFVPPGEFVPREGGPSEEQHRAAAALPLRRDVVALVTYLRDHKVTGTQSTGNFPLKAVGAIGALFVEPPELTSTIGEQTYKVQSELEVWPLYFRHVLASVGGLIQGGPGRRWQVTTAGQSFLAASPVQQVWHLLVTWFTRINWAIAFPYDFLGGAMPPGFARLTLHQLLDLPVDEPVPFESFADRFIKAAGVVWPNVDVESGRRLLHNFIERLVIDPLLDFALLTAEYRPREMPGHSFRELSAIELNATGREFLAALNELIGDFW